MQIQIVQYIPMKKTRIGQTHRSQMPDAVTDTAIVEVKHRMSAVRGLRDGLVQLAIMLADQPEKNGYLLLINPRLSLDRLKNETEAFKAVMRLDVAERLLLVVVTDNRIVEQPSGMSPPDVELLRRYMVESARTGLSLPSSGKQEEVFLVMLQQWITGRGPMTARWLEDAVGCNYRTVSATIDRLGPAVKRHSDRRVSLKYFPEQDWKRVLAVTSKVRSTAHYADASDQPRSFESLLRRLHQLARKDIAVGGVFGAKHYYPELDIVGAPRLDLCLHAPGSQADLDFVKQLDPALEETRDHHQPARLAVHFLRRKEPLFDQEKDGYLWADPAECLLELFEARLDPQALGFQEFLTMRGRELNDES